MSPNYFGYMEGIWVIVSTWWSLNKNDHMYRFDLLSPVNNIEGGYRNSVYQYPTATIISYVTFLLCVSKYSLTLCISNLRDMLLGGE